MFDEIGRRAADCDKDRRLGLLYLPSQDIGPLRGLFSLLWKVTMAGRLQSLLTIQAAGTLFPSVVRHFPT